MPTIRQRISSTEIEQIVAQRVTSAIKAIAIYETKIRTAHDLIVWDVHQGAKVARNANNKRKWEGGYQNNMGQQNKRQKVVRAYTPRPDNKNGYAWKFPFWNKCKLHHTSPCTVKCNNCKIVGHITRNCRTLVPVTTQRPLVANQKPVVTCFRCGAQGYFKSKCPRSKYQNRCNQKGNKGKAHGTLTSL
ncbi:reverse transcriptase domain-containing protein [Tanacetum coccineum]